MFKMNVNVSYMESHGLKCDQVVKYDLFILEQQKMYGSLTGVVTTEY